MRQAIHKTHFKEQRKNLTIKHTLTQHRTTCPPKIKHDTQHHENIKGETTDQTNHKTKDNAANTQYKNMENEQTQHKTQCPPKINTVINITKRQHMKQMKNTSQNK